MPKKSSSMKRENTDVAQAKPSPLNMAKKKNPKKPIQEQENGYIEQAKSSSTPKKTSYEIDEIFSGKKRKKPEQKKADEANENGEEKSKSMKKERRMGKEDEEGRFTEPPSRPRKKTENGFTVYTEEELGFNKSNAGGTPLCPFDCDCCF